MLQKQTTFELTLQLSTTATITPDDLEQILIRTLEYKLENAKVEEIAAVKTGEFCYDCGYDYRSCQC